MPEVLSQSRGEGLFRKGLHMIRNFPSDHFAQQLQERARDLLQSNILYTEAEH